MMFKLFKRKKKTIVASQLQALDFLDQLDKRIQTGRDAVKRNDPIGFRSSLHEIETLLTWFHDTYVKRV